MKRRRLQLSLRQRRTFYLTSLLLFGSGTVWKWLQRLDQTQYLGEGGRNLKQVLIQLHGMSAVVFVLLLGTLLSGHVRRSWHAGKNRWNGAGFLALISVLTISGYMLYYLGDEAWRAAASTLHLWLGLAMPVLLFWHIRSGRKSTTGSGRGPAP